MQVPFSLPFGVSKFLSTINPATVATNLIAGLKDLVLNLGSVGSTSVEDKSKEGNNATLYTGRYVSTDGVNDQAINADLSGYSFTDNGLAPSVRLTGKVRCNTGTTLCVSVGNNFGASQGVGASGVWVDFDFTLNKDFGTVDTLILGFNNQTAEASDSDWSDVRIYDVGTGDLVAHYPLTEHNSPTADTLDGLPCFDASGNGYHGTHSGCAGFTGEGIDPDFVGAAFEANEDKMYFDGAYVIMSTPVDLSGDFKLEWTGFIRDQDTHLFATSNLSSERFRFGGSDAGGFAGPRWIASVGGSYEVQFDPPAPNTFTEVLTTFTIERIGDSMTVSTTAGYSSTKPVNKGWASSTFYFYRSTGLPNCKGFAYDLKLNEVLIADGAGTDPSNWGGGTVVGAASTIGQKRATILQTAGLDWNREVLAYESEFTNGVLGDLAYQSNCTASVIGNDYAEITVAASGLITYGSSNAEGVYYGPHPIPGRTYRISFEVYLPSGNTEVTGLFFQARWGAVDADVIGGYSRQAPMTTTDQWVTVEDTITIVGGRALSFRVNDGTFGNFTVTEAAIGDTFRIRNFSMVDVGILVPTSDSNPATDSIGNAITKPRVNNKVLNLFGDGEYASVPDADSLDGFTDATWEVWMERGSGGVYRSIVSKESEVGQLSWSIFEHASWNAIGMDLSPDGSTISQISFAWSDLDTGSNIPPGEFGCLTIVKSGTDILWYWNAVLRETDSGSAPATLFNSTSDVNISSRREIWFSDKQRGGVTVFNTALTPEEVLQNFNAQKAQYGL